MYNLENNLKTEEKRGEIEKKKKKTSGPETTEKKLICR